MSDILKKLKQTREGYEDERIWHRLMLDGYSGGGGFQGAAVQPMSGFWGSAAEVYSSDFQLLNSSADIQRVTYLDRFPREDTEKFRRRVLAAHYPNYIGPLTDLKISFLTRKPFTVENRSEAIEQWREDIDGRGTPFTQTLHDCVLRSATVGWIPAVVDMPIGPRDENGRVLPLTKRQSQDLGLTPRVIPMFPANLLDYQCDGNDFRWAKIRTDHTDQPSPWDDRSKVSEFTIWYPDYFEKWEHIEGQTEPTQIAEAEHPFGEVPIAVLPYKPMPDDPVKGIPMHGQETIEARALFNRQSELDEHMRGQVFAILVLVAGEDEEIGEIIAGTDNGIYLDPESSNQHYYLSPDPAVAESYEKRIEVTIQEMYRQARVEFTRPQSSRQAVSGIARKFEFAHTDRAIADFARQVARFQSKIDRLVARGLGAQESESVYTPPPSFDVEDVQSDIDIGVSAIKQLGIGGTAEKSVRMRIIRQLLPDASAEDMEKIESEVEQILDAQAAAEANERAMMERTAFGEPVAAE